MMVVLYCNTRNNSSNNKMKQGSLAGRTRVIYQDEDDDR